VREQGVTFWDSDHDVVDLLPQRTWVGDRDVLRPASQAENTSAGPVRLAGDSRTDRVSGLALRRSGWRAGRIGSWLPQRCRRMSC
jgi:hypothetical protein